MYVHCRLSDSVASAVQLEGCVKEVDSWMASNRLKFNPSQTELMMFGTTLSLEKLLPAMTDINSVVKDHVKSANSLGMTLDDELKLVKHIATVCRPSYYQIRQLKHIRWYLDVDSAFTLVHSFIISRIDYCNGLLASAQAYKIDQLNVC